jgi:predicted anti-sigma-YlaC factor YlaD
MVPNPSSRAISCREVVECTTAYLEEYVQHSARVSMDFHLAGCADCRTYVKQIALVREATALLPRPVFPPPNQARLRQYFAQRHAPLQQPKQFGYAGDVSGRTQRQHLGVQRSSTS